jgi:hypothetical protein
LRAVNVAATRGGRPRWLIDVADLVAFESCRAAKPPIPAQRLRRPQEVTTYF